MQASYLTYIANINNSFADYTLSLARKETIGLRKISRERELLNLLKWAINAITSYLYGVDDDVAFCDATQAQRYVDIINIICNTNDTYN